MLKFAQIEVIDSLLLFKRFWHVKYQLTMDDVSILLSITLMKSQLIHNLSETLIQI